MSDKQTMTQRNEAICDYYKAGRKLSQTASHFKLGRQRVLQILKEANVWKPYEKGTRTKFLGVTVSEATKDGLTKMAEEKGTSVSQLTSDVLEREVAR